MGATVYEQNMESNQEELVKEFLPLVKKIGLHLVARPAAVDRAR